MSERRRAAPEPISAGIDGCRRGWVLVLRTPTRAGARFACAAHRCVADAIDQALGCGAAAIGIDMPIGMSADGRRRADGEARARLGPRRSSVFPTPVRSVLDATDFHDALDRSRRVSGRGLSIQAWNLVPKIAELDRWVTPDHDELLFEVHPELAFARLAGGAPLPDAKRTPAGAAHRAALLRTAVRNESFDPVAERARLGAGVAVDDVADAAAVACSAAQLAVGRGTALGDGARDARGLPMRICY